uniref:ORF n=1 Tax=Ceratodon purpureus TaxID=3225 RepID=O24445_CERPU|nr:ORF [Ceratodon purpureus]AAB67862.1 unnamed protein product [Ceratodon purpureus]
MKEFSSTSRSLMIVGIY